MTRKDKKQDKPASRRSAAEDKKRKGKRKRQADGTALLRSRSEAPKPRGSDGKTKKRRKRSATDSVPPPTPVTPVTPMPPKAPATTTAVDAQILPHIDLGRNYELTADGVRVLRERLDAMARLSALGLGRLVPS